MERDTGRDLHSIHCDIHSGEDCSQEPTCPRAASADVCTQWCIGDDHFYACPNHVTRRRTVDVIAYDLRKKLLERAENLLDHNDLDNAVALINAAKGLE